MGQGHRVTFKMNTSLTEITKAYTSYMKLKEGKGSLTKGGQASQYLEEYYQVWDEYFCMTPEKGQLITPATICWEQKEQKIGFGDHPLDPKELPSLHQPPVNLPYRHARWTRSVFQWYEYLAALFVPSVGTMGIMVKVEALTNFTKQALLVLKPFKL